MRRKQLAAAGMLAFAASLTATTWYVSPTGNDARRGTTRDSSFRHIQKGADVAQPGDTVLVFAGTYRERVKPPRGGSGDDARITYRANPGDRVVITGLDVWKAAWVADGKLHKATPPQSMFTDTAYVDGGNPFRAPYGGGRGGCLGYVVVDGKEFVEQRRKEDVADSAGRWWADVETGTIYVNFGGSPAGKKVEITARRGVFRPYLLGLGYLTVEGFVMEYCANQTMDGFYTAGNNRSHQSGLIGTRSGHHWIIRNNVIRKARSVGLTIGTGGFYKAPYYNFMAGPTYFSYGPHENIDNETPLQAEPDLRTVGYNLIVNNTFDSIGQCGIAGLGHFGNTIYGNRFSNIPCRKTRRGSFEDGEVKIHYCFGTIIEKNLFEATAAGSWMLWLDAAAVGNRISRNVFTGRSEGNYCAVFVEITSARDYCVNVIDNNLFLGTRSGIGGSRADGVGIYHNLFYGCDFAYNMGSAREDCGDTNRCGCGATRIFALNNLLIDCGNNYGLPYPPRETRVASDYNVLIPGGRNFQIVNQGTGNAKWCGGKNYTSVDIDNIYKSLGRPGKYWNGKDTAWVQFGGHGPSGCVGDFAAWKAMMKGLDAHSAERGRDSCALSGRSIAVDLREDPRIGGKSIKGVGVDFSGSPISATPRAGPLQGLDTALMRTAFWDDAALPSLPSPPAAPSDFAVRRISSTVNRLSWTNKAPDAHFIAVERCRRGDPWETWGYVVTLQDTLRDDQLDTASAYSYRIAARNAAGLSAWVQR